MKGSFLAASILLSLTLATWAAPAAQDAPTWQAELKARVTLGAGECVSSQIALDASSLEAIFLHPKEILGDINGFWRTDRAYWLTSKWHEGVGYPVPPFGWQQAIERIAAGSEGESEEIGRAVALIDSLERGRQDFLDRAVPHICSFFPDNKVNLSTTVFLTAAIIPNAFQKDFNVVVNATHPDWKMDASTIWNTVVHEVAHVGFYRHEGFMREVQPDNIEEYDIYFNLMNEGMATYIAFTAQEFCPADNNDYRLLENADSVKCRLAELNAMLAQAETLPPDEFRRMMWTVGVQRRALYIGGGHMARTIEAKLGRHALVDAMELGPRSFVAAYNALVEDTLRVPIKGLPDTLSVCQQMRQAALGEDYGNLRRLLALLENDEEGAIAPAQHVLNTTGYLLLNRDELDLAEAVFSLYLRLFPQAENPCRGLGSVYVLKGDYVRASEAYKKLLDIAPTNAIALEMLDLLGSE